MNIKYKLGLSDRLS